MGPPEDFGFIFVTFAPTKLFFFYFFLIKGRLCVLYVEESFDTIFNMGYGRGRTMPPPWIMGRKKSPMDERVNCVSK